MLFHLRTVGPIIAFLPIFFPTAIAQSPVPALNYTGLNLCLSVAQAIIGVDPVSIVNPTVTSGWRLGEQSAVLHTIELDEFGAVTIREDLVAADQCDAMETDEFWWSYSEEERRASAEFCLYGMREDEMVRVSMVTSTNSHQVSLESVRSIPVVAVCRPSSWSTQLDWGQARHFGPLIVGRSPHL